MCPEARSALARTFVVEARPLRSPDAPTEAFEVVALRAHTAAREFAALRPDLKVTSVRRKP